MQFNDNAYIRENIFSLISSELQLLKLQRIHFQNIRIHFYRQPRRCAF